MKIPELLKIISELEKRIEDLEDVTYGLRALKRNKFIPFTDLIGKELKKLKKVRKGKK